MPPKTPPTNHPNPSHWLLACRVYAAVEHTYYMGDDGRLHPKQPLQLTGEQEFSRVQSAQAEESR